MGPHTDERAQSILDFWFLPETDPGHGTARDVWFAEGRSIDATVRERFLADHEAAAAGAYDRWRDEAGACLALILLFDQFPRHMFRDTARAYETDPLALATARHALARGFDREAPVFKRNFFYLPFTHAEDLAAQHQSVHLRKALPDTYENKEKSILRAVEHMEVIERFGRFPHRNDIVGRESTPDEIAFLDADPEAWFAKYRKRA